jgi:hypothetical protein
MVIENKGDPFVDLFFFVLPEVIFDEFFEHANSIHPSLKFTHEVSKTKISFLDTTTTVKESNMTK